MLITRKPRPNIGDIKIVRKFVILPRFTDDKFAWLGLYTLKYERVLGYTVENGIKHRQELWFLIDITK